FFYFTYTSPPLFYTLSLHDALPIYCWRGPVYGGAIHLLLLDYARKNAPTHLSLALGRNRSLRLIWACLWFVAASITIRRATLWRSEEHTSELQSRGHLVCRLLLEKK